MKTLRPTEYMYASARIRSLENRLVGRERTEILMESRTPNEVMERLAEYGYTPAESADGSAPAGEEISAAREAMLLAARVRPKFIGGERAYYDDRLKDGYPEE